MGGSDAQLRQSSRISGLHGLLPGEQASWTHHNPPRRLVVHCWPAHKRMALLSPAEYAAFYQTDRGRADWCVHLQYAHGRFAEVMEQRQSMAQFFNCTSTTSKADQQDVVATAVGAELFAYPEKGATCSMCLRYRSGAVTAASASNHICSALKVPRL